MNLRQRYLDVVKRLPIYMNMQEGTNKEIVRADLHADATNILVENELARECDQLSMIDKNDLLEIQRQTKPLKDDIDCPFCHSGTVLQYEWIDATTKGKLLDSYPCEECNGTGRISKKVFTCYGCKDNDKCPHAWCSYNTNGDCLADK